MSRVRHSTSSGRGCNPQNTVLALDAAEPVCIRVVLHGAMPATCPRATCPRARIASHAAYSVLGMTHRGEVHGSSTYNSSVALKLLLNAALFIPLWILFVFQLTPSEIVVGTVCSALAAFALYATLEIVPLCFQPKLRWIAQCWRLPGMIAQDLWILLKALARHLGYQPSQAVFQLEHFDATGEDCRAAARRALAVLFLSITPNSVVLLVDLENSTLFLHQLTPAPMSKLARNLQD